MFNIFKWLLSLWPRRKESYKDEYALKIEERKFNLEDLRKSNFQILEDPAYSCQFSEKGIKLQLKKGNSLAWSELEHWRVADIEIKASIIFDPDSVYSSAGLLFRKTESENYYLFLLSSKGLWRLDQVFNGNPQSLIPWTELPKGREITKEESIELSIIAIDRRITLVIDRVWAGEILDDTHFAGTIALALANYEEGGRPSVILENLSLNSRPRDVEETWRTWAEEVPPMREARLTLAQSFMAIQQPSAALVQIKKIWKQREEKLPAELLLASEAAISLSLLQEAKSYIYELLELLGPLAKNTPTESETSSPEQFNIANMQDRAIELELSLLYLEGNYSQLYEKTNLFLLEQPDNSRVRTLLAHALYNLGRYEAAAIEYEQLAEQAQKNDRTTEQGLLFKNAAQAYENSGNTEKALELWLNAGNAFLNTEEYMELSLLLPTLLKWGNAEAKVHALSAKYHFAMENWIQARIDLQSARNLCARVEDIDPAVPYLQGLLLIREGKRAKAIELLEEAVSLQSDYYPFLFRLAESRWLSGTKSDIAKLEADLPMLLEHAEADGWLYNLVACFAMDRQDWERAKAMLAQAEASLGSIKEVRANKAELASRQGHHEQALEYIASYPLEGDPLIDTRRGNILYRLGRLEDAEEAFRLVLKKDDNNPEWYRNLAGCLIEQGRYGEADELLAKAYEIEPAVKTLELIAYVAGKKGEYPRAEASLRLGLEAEPHNTDLLFSLAWNYVQMARYERANECIAQLEELIKKNSPLKQSLAELENAITMATTRNINCSLCNIQWTVPRELPPQGALSLRAEPPDTMPAGICPNCSKTYCIGCVKQTLVDRRFHCPDCQQALKLSDNGIVKILNDWLSNLE